MTKKNNFNKATDRHQFLKTTKLLFSYLLLCVIEVRGRRDKYSSRSLQRKKTMQLGIRPPVTVLGTERGEMAISPIFLSMTLLGKRRSEKSRFLCRQQQSQTFDDDDNKRRIFRWLVGRRGRKMSPPKRMEKRGTKNKHNQP